MPGLKSGQIFAQDLRMSHLPMAMSKPAMNAARNQPSMTCASAVCSAMAGTRTMQTVKASRVPVSALSLTARSFPIRGMTSLILAMPCRVSVQAKTMHSAPMRMAVSAFTRDLLGRPHWARTAASISAMSIFFCFIIAAIALTDTVLSDLNVNSVRRLGNTCQDTP